MKKRILVIGGDSFVGGYFIRSSANIYDFRSISRVKQGFDSEKVIDDLFELDQQDFEGVDVVINFAAIVHRPGLKDVELYERINYKLPVRLAKQAEQSKVGHFIQISSMAVYGHAEYIDQNTVCDPKDLYSASKLKADEALMQWSEATGMAITIIRPSMIYGGGRAPGNMQRLIQLVNNKYPLPFKGVRNARQFLHISNFDLALNYCIENRIPGRILLADPEAISTSDLLSAIGKALNKPVRQFHLPGFWRMVSFVKKDLNHKLTGDLRIENTIPFSQISENPYSIQHGIGEMIQKNYDK